MLLFFVFKQKTAYEMSISDWSSDVCSSDLLFVGLWLIGNPVDVLISSEATEADRLAAMKALGLDRPIWEQYLVFLGNAVQGDWRSEERRVGKGSVSTCRSRWSPYH